MEQELEKKIKDLQFLLRREKVENKSKLKEILFQLLELHTNFEKLLKNSHRYGEEIEQSIAERFALTGKKLMQIVQRAGAIKINSLGESYNPEYHEIVKESYRIDLSEERIVEVEEEGYLFEGEVLRPAKVITVTHQETNPANP